MGWTLYHLGICCRFDGGGVIDELFEIGRQYNQVYIGGGDPTLNVRKYVLVGVGRRGRATAATSIATARHCCDVVGLKAEDLDGSGTDA